MFIEAIPEYNNFVLFQKVSIGDELRKVDL